MQNTHGNVQLLTYVWDHNLLLVPLTTGPCSPSFPSAPFMPAWPYTSNQDLD